MTTVENPDPRVQDVLELRRRAKPLLTPRQHQILTRVAEGETNTVIARRLGISPDTLRTHLRQAMRRVGARNRAQAVAIAFRAGELR